MSGHVEPSLIIHIGNKRSIKAWSDTAKRRRRIGSFSKNQVCGRRKKSTLSSLLNLSGFLSARYLRSTETVSERKGETVFVCPHMLFSHASSLCGKVNHTDVRLEKGQRVVYQQ